MVVEFLTYPLFFLTLVIAWIIIRGKNSSTTQLSSKNLLPFLISGVAYLMVYLGFFNVLRIIIELVSGDSTSYQWGNSAIREELAAWLALGIVGLPLFLFLWARLNKLIQSLPPEQMEVEKKEKKNLATYFVWLSSFISLSVVVYFVYVVLTFLLQVGTFKISQFSTPLSGLLLSILTFAYYYPISKSQPKVVTPHYQDPTPPVTA